MVGKPGTRAPVGPRGSSKITVSRQDPVTMRSKPFAPSRFKRLMSPMHLNPGFVRIEAVGHRVDSRRRQSCTNGKGRPRTSLLSHGNRRFTREMPVPMLAIRDPTNWERMGGVLGRWQRA